MKGQSDSLKEYKDKVTGFDWAEQGEDLVALRDIAQRHAPGGEFRLIEDFKVPDGDDIDSEVVVKMSPVLTLWLRWLEKKYDLDTAYVILGKFGEIVLCSPEEPRDHSQH